MGTFRHTILNEITIGGRIMATPSEPLPVTEILTSIKAAKPQSLDQLQRLFFYHRVPSSTDALCVQVLAKAISMGKLLVNAEFLTTNPPLDSSLKNKGGQIGRTVESPEHQGMKLWIKAFFEEKGVSCAEEISYLGYKVDVGNLKKNIFIECGDTEPRKVFEFLRHAITIGVLQYYSEEIVWFVPDVGFSEFANLLTQDRLA